jgi:hypothetical protein
MRDDVMPEKIVVNAALDLASLGTPQDVTVKFARAIEVIDCEREMKKSGAQRDLLSLDCETRGGASELSV